MAKPIRTIQQGIKKPIQKEVISLYRAYSWDKIIWGCDHHANFVDIISLAPITGIKYMYINDVNISEGEYSDSNFFQHDGVGRSQPWAGGEFPYVERTIGVGVQAEAQNVGDGNFSTTVVNRTVSSLGVLGVRVNFTTSGFTHQDNKGRDRAAGANFSVEYLDEDGNVLETVKSLPIRGYFLKNPTGVQLTCIPSDTSVSEKIWSYRIKMNVRYDYYQTAVSGNWTVSTVTELYKDTQVYENIAYCSGSLIANNVSNSTPTRQYLVEGYKVLVPKYTEVNNKYVFKGEFVRETSSSPAWNLLAVLTDTLWGGSVPFDKINIVSFLAFHKYCSEEIDGVPRYSHSQHLISSDNYYKLAAQIAGAADGKLYEDTSGRLSIMFDSQTDNRRLITTYDVVNESVKRTTVSESSKTNRVEAEFEDKSNNYKSTIISTEDFSGITSNGVIEESLTLDTCTEPKEAKRIIEKTLAISQIASSSYVFSVGHTHEDLQIGEVVELYDRIYSRANYCGKTAEGSTLSIIQVDVRTPIDLSMMEDAKFVIDNNRGEPLVVDILEWTSRSITLSEPLETLIPSFTSFGVRDGANGGLKPTLIRVIGTNIKDTGEIEIEGVEYNDTLYDYIEIGSELVVEKTKYLPPSTPKYITGLTLSHNKEEITVGWDDIEGWQFNYYWKRYGENDPLTGYTVDSGTVVSPTTSVSLSAPFEPVKYSFHVHAVQNGKSTDIETVEVNLTINEAATSSLLPASNLGVENSEGLSVGVYTGRGFTLKWDQDISQGSAKYYIIRISQSGNTLEKRIDGDLRSQRITESELTELFGSSYLRDFELTLIGVDESLLSAEPVTRLITNTAPLAPNLEVQATGDLRLTGTVPDDAVSSTVLVWKGTDLLPPIYAIEVESAELSEINIPNNYIIYDGSTYTFEAAWVDSFGKTGVNYGRATFVANPALLVPVTPELLLSSSIKDDTVYITYSHEGTWLERIIVEYRNEELGGDWTTHSTILQIPAPDGETDYGYDIESGEGYFFMRGLSLNTGYEFKVRAASLTSSYSEDSNIITGSGFFSVDDIQENILKEVDVIVSRADTRDVAIEDLSRAVFDLTSEYQGMVNAYELRTINGEAMIDAAVYIDPDSGQIVNRAFAYTDESFTEASLLIDGVDGRVTIEAARISSSEDRIAQAESAIVVNAGDINLRATYTDVDNSIASAMESLLPAYSWQYNTGSDGWTGATWNAAGYLEVTSSNTLAVTSISFDADTNMMIETSVKTSGNILGAISWNGGSQNIPLNVEDTANEWTPLRKELTALDGWTGTITSLEFTSDGDIDIDYIVVGQRSASDVALTGIEARTSTIETDIDAGTGSMSQYGTTTWVTGLGYQTQSDVGTLIDTFDSTYSITATLQEFDDNGTLEKANTAQTWVDAADANITNVIVAYNSLPDGIDDTITVVQSDIDGLNGKISDQIVSIRGLEVADRENGLEGILGAYNEYIQEDFVQKESIKLAYANETLEATVTDLEATAEKTLELAAFYDESSARIDQSFIAIANESSARSSQYTELSATITSNKDLADAEFVEVRDAVATVDGARVEQGEVLITKIDTDVSSAKEEAKAAIGWCSFSGEASDHDTKDACIIAGGEWLETPLAQAVKQVKVTSGGETTTVEALYTAQLNLEGEMEGRATIGVTNAGVFTGIDIIGGANYSDMIFKAGGFEFQDSNGITQLNYNSGEGLWEFAGTVRIGATKLSEENTLNSYNDPLGSADQALIDAKIDAQAKADLAESNAVTTSNVYTEAKADLAETQAKAYADGIVTIEEERAIADAQAKADAAEAAAISAAAVDAQAKAYAAEENAATNANVADKTDGSVGGWSLSSNYIYSGTSPHTSNGYASSGMTLFKDGGIRTPQFYISHIDGSAHFKGELEAASGTFTGELKAASGTFTGTVYAKNINGDVIDAVVKETTYAGWDEEISLEKKILEMRILPENFNRIFLVPSFHIEGGSVTTWSIKLRDVSNNNIVASHLARGYQEGVAIITRNMTVNVPPNTTREYSLHVEPSLPTGSIGTGICQVQDIVLQIFKQGTSII